MIGDNCVLSCPYLPSQVFLHMTKDGKHLVNAEFCRTPNCCQHNSSGNGSTSISGGIQVPAKKVPSAIPRFLCSFSLRKAADGNYWNDDRLDGSVFFWDDGFRMGEWMEIVMRLAYLKGNRHKANQKSLI